MRLAKEQQEAQAERQTDQKEEEEKETPNPESQDRLIKIPKAKTLAQLIEEQELLKQSEANIGKDDLNANETDLLKDKILSKSNIEDNEQDIDKQESQKDEMDDIDSIKNLSEHHRLHKQQDRLEVQSEEQDWVSVNKEPRATYANPHDLELVIKTTFMKKSYSNIPEFSDVQSEEIFLQIGETNRDIDQGVANQSKYLSNW